MADDQRIADLYDKDFYLWTQAQAEALRSAGEAGRLVDMDWERLAGEIEDLGKRDLKAALSLTTRIIEHLHLLAASTREEPKAHWRTEILAFRGDLELELTPTIRRLVEEALDARHAQALKVASAKLIEMQNTRAPDPSRRWTLPQILGEEDDPLKV